MIRATLRSSAKGVSLVTLQLPLFPMCVFAIDGRSRLYSSYVTFGGNRHEKIASRSRILRGDIICITFKNRPRDRKAKTGSLWLCRYERIEDAFRFVARNTISRVRYFHLKVWPGVLARSDRQVVRPWLVPPSRPCPFITRFMITCSKWMGSHRTGNTSHAVPCATPRRSTCPASVGPVIGAITNSRARALWGR